jgi:GWxTD domain-containing protein
MKRILLYTLLLLIVVSCGTSRKASNKSEASSFKHDANTIHPQFTLFNTTDTITELHFKIASKELLYTRPDGIKFSSNVLVSYRLFPNFDSREMIDSASVRVVDEGAAIEDKFLIGMLKITAKTRHSYCLRVSVTDMNKNISASAILYIDKENDLNRENFIIKNKKTDMPLFCNYSKTGQELVIQYKAKMAVNLYVRYYKRDFPIAAPPFSMADPDPFKYKPDSTFTLQLSADGKVDFATRKTGFYHFQLDTSKHDGITIFNFSDVFPEVKKAEDMVPPLRFITTKQEFDELTKSTNKKLSIEKFWTTCAGSQERAKDVIKKYYNRMQDANFNFTSYLEGWKTDRGMIYLIYGAPNTIYRSATSETWTYGEENNINSLQYSFSKVDNPFTDNDYTLDRSGVYKQSWYVAVDIWRQGKTYLQE